MPRPAPADATPARASGRRAQRPGSRGPQRETEDQARARRAGAQRGRGGRQAIDEEIEEGLEALMDEGDDFGFFDREEEEKP
jgi:hypothetical protein